jgi:hypothetical protein
MTVSFSKGGVKFSISTAFVPPKTILSTPKTGIGFRSGSQHHAWQDPELLLVKLRAAPFGSWVVVGNEIVREGKTVRKVLCRCSQTGIEKLVNIDNLLSGKSKGPHEKSRSSLTAHPRYEKIAARYDAMWARCNNPQCEWYPQYGGRGIKLKFGSRQVFAAWILKNLPHPNYRGVQIDRINNDGHYEPGNLRLVTPQQNLRNKQQSKFVTYQGMKVNACDIWHLLRTDHPEFKLSKDRTAKLAGMGVAPEEILKKVARGPYRNSKSMTLPMPDPAIVSLYREK